LIELLIVVGIITILASAVIIGINPGQHFEQARNTARMGHMSSIVNGVYTYVIANDGVEPACIDDTPRDLYECYGELLEGEGIEDYERGFINDLPQDPSVGGGSYSWSASTDIEGDGEKWDGQSVDCPEDIDGEAEDCTGYIIGNVNGAIRIISAADEGYENEIEVTR